MIGCTKAHEAAPSQGTIKINTLNPLRERSGGIIAVAITLTLLYFGRDVLIPLTLALMLGLLVAPLVRTLRGIGLGRTPSVLVAVVALALVCGAVAVALGIQVLRMASSLPQYQQTIQQKLQTLNEVTVGRLTVLTSQASHLIDIQHPAAGTPPPTTWLPPVQQTPESNPPGSQPGATDRPQPLKIIGALLSSVWLPVQTTGIVLVVLIFVLLEHEALRDRFIRIAGVKDIRSTTLALNDAGERLSRFFVSQFAVNLGFGVAISLSLRLLGVPQAMLWGTLAGVLRFVPYVGVWIAALFATALAFAVDPGWSLAVATLSTFLALDVIAGQLVEPQLYGHATGLSPLSVVVAAIFWSSLWGPAGLILSTPLTLCLVVAGRHMKALSLLELLLGNADALTLPQRFYQRAISGDSQELIADARDFLKANPLAAYCDLVLVPALHLARLYDERGGGSEDNNMRVRNVVVTVIGAIDGSSRKFPRLRGRGSVLDHLNAGQRLRQQREQLSGRWQGPLQVPPGTVMVCIGMGSSADDLATELLVRVLRSEKVDGRHFSISDADAGLPPGADPNAVSIVYLVSAFPSAERERGDAVVQKVRELLPRAHVVKVFFPGLSEVPGPFDGIGAADQTASSFVQATQICVECQREPSRA
jgi:predicted PurR-regulated permease PerM